MSRLEVRGFIAQIEIEPDGDGFHAFCRALPGLHVAGDTEAEALKNATDGVEAYMDSLTKHGDAILLHRAECSVWRYVVGLVPIAHWRCDCQSSQKDRKATP